MRDSRGFSLVEVLVAIAIFSTAVIAFFGASQVALKASSKSGDKIQAAFLLEEGMEAVKYLRDTSWKMYIKNQNIFYDQCLVFDDATQLFTTNQPDNVLLMHFDESAGATSFVNSASSAVNGTCSLCPTSGVMGVSDPSLNTGVSFTTIPQFITFPYTSAFDLPSQISVSGWIKVAANADTTVRPFISKTNDFSFGVRTNKPVVTLAGVNGGGVLEAPSSDSITPDSWIHVAFTYSQTTNLLKIYINGVPQNSLAVSGTHTFATGQQLFIGSLNFIGSVDEVSMYGRVLSDSEIKYLAERNMPACGTGLGDFVRTLRFKNTCRADSDQNISGTVYQEKDIVGHTISQNTTAGACGIGASTLDLDTKHVLINVTWGSNKEFSEKMESYILNIFKDE